MERTGLFAQKVLVIAEAGVNHNGSLETALRMVEVAAEAGAGAVKFQSFHAGRLVHRAAPKAAYQLRYTQAAESQYEMLKRLELDASSQRQLASRCRELGVGFLSSPFDLESLAFLVDELDVEAIKIPSGEITHGRLLWETGRSGKPCLLSTGMSTLDEVAQALGVLAFGYIQSPHPPSPEAFAEALHSEAGSWAVRRHVTLLHCTTEYPAPFHETNLRAMDTLRAAFGTPVGLSDHTEGIAAALAAVARGAVVVEKHFTLDRNLPGPDHKASLEPPELAQLVEGVRQVESALGSGVKAPSPSEYKNLPIARKSLCAARSIQRGERFSEENLTALRPGAGVSPMRYWEYLGQLAGRDYAKGEMIDPR
ncbi:MAG: N-acetylneuraminate synthase [Magnetococcales bacterium]|nr:N-acetylneuraminate synthase [Magnetococcales bacterium]